ncbi:hypothetical protein [Streptomyces sp. NPDC006510]|uniref:hypothetical protein n=1 Tax=Streptomyces sp. NPDC006510 TaxID=3155600 RepID=UPI0033B1D6E5
MQLIGMAEARINLTYATVAIAAAPMSPAVIRGMDQDFEHGFVAQRYLPDRVLGTQRYAPTANGFEQTINQRLNAIRSLTQLSTTRVDTEKAAA